MSVQKKDSRALVLVVNKKRGWARIFVEAVATPFAATMIILFSFVLGGSLNIILSRSDSPSAPIRVSNPAVAASTAHISVPPRPTTTAAAAASTAPILAPPPPTPAAATVASTAPVSAPPPSTPAAATAASTAPMSVPPAPTPAAAAAASTAPVTVPPRPNSTVAILDRDEVAALLARGRASLSNGDVAGARLILQWAAEHDDSRAALALGETYDPTVLKRLGIIKFADLAQAREWYRRAADLGSATATSRLYQLSNTDRLSR
jgi:hypothetical protein